MEEKDLIFQEYKLYAEQKEKFIDRNFATNKFYMVALVVAILALIYTNDVVFMGKLTATLLFSVIGMAVCTLWWMNIDSYNTLIKVKFSNVLEKLEEKLPVKPFQEEYKGIEEFKNKKVFMFSDIQKLISILCCLFFFVIFICEVTPLLVAIFNKLLELLAGIKVGI